jgi:hypothetical protein
MPEPITLLLGGLAKLLFVKGGAAVGTKTALMHTAIATEGAVSSATTVGGAAGAVYSGASYANSVAKEEQKQKNKRGY